MKRKNKYILIGVFLLAIISGAIYAIYYIGWTSYKNRACRFEIRYPKRWSIVNEIKEEDNRCRVSFSSKQERGSFGKVEVDFYNKDDKNKFFEDRVSTAKKSGILEEAQIENAKGYKFKKTDGDTSSFKVKSVTFYEIFQGNSNEGVFTITGDGVDQTDSSYREQVEISVKSFKILTNSP